MAASFTTENAKITKNDATTDPREYPCRDRPSGGPLIAPAPHNRVSFVQPSPPMGLASLERQTASASTAAEVYQTNPNAPHESGKTPAHAHDRGRSSLS